MYRYHVFGGRLESEVPLPDLRVADSGSADWSFRLTSDPFPLGDAELLGREELVPGTVVRLLRGSDRHRVAFDDTGTFDIAPGGRTITWAPSHGDAALARLDLLGRVLAVAMHFGGDLCLHASAVTLHGRAIALLGAKGFGKSTLALALVRAGARLLADDTLRVRPGTPPIAEPGLRSARLRSDSADYLARRSAADGEPDGAKFVVRRFAEQELADGPAPLSTIYLLSPVNALPDGAAVRRRELTASEATLALVANAKAAALLGKDEGGALLRRTAAIARGDAARVFALDVVRSLDRLPEVVGALRSWHDGSGEGDA